MTVHTQPAYQIRAAALPPPDYPAAPTRDTFASEPFLPDFAARRQAFFAHILRSPAPANTKPAWHELARLAAGGQPHLGVFEAALDFIEARKDCADFVLHGILRLVYMLKLGQLPDGAAASLPEALLARVRDTILNFKYFPNEPGIDSLCTWTENHFILFTSAACLAGQLYPDETFPNSGESGRRKIALNRTRILRWLDLRFHTGFSEWLSHVYYDEDLATLLALYDFAEDEEIRRKAGQVLDLLVFDMALNSFKGVFGSTHGRAYENTKKLASNEGTTDICKLLFGMGVFSGFDNMSAVALALSSYRAPAVLEQIAAAPTLESRQRMGIRLAEMERWGLRPDNFEDGMLYLTLEAYLHPRTIANTIRMFDTCNWWENSFLNNFKPYRPLLKALGAVGGLPHLARLLERDVCRNTREEVNICTYKTPDYMLSTAQDYRKGYGGDQQHIWQATLGENAVCFTTHPAKLEGVTPNYWAGSGLLPRAGQVRSVAVVVYKLEKIPALYVPIRLFFTHAWLPQAQFDEVSEKNGWVFARKGSGYLALRSQNPWFWAKDEPSRRMRTPEERRPTEAGLPAGMADEIIAAGAENIWVCQMGRQAEDGTFGEFIEKIASAEITFEAGEVRYHSPREGLIRFGWEGPLLVDGAPVELHGYPRYANPFCQAEFNPDEIEIQAGAQALKLNWKTGEREER